MLAGNQRVACCQNFLRLSHSSSSSKTDTQITKTSWRMSLGSHIVKRGRNALSTSGWLISAPREPLVFLYPLWIRTAATDARNLSVGGQKPPSTGYDHLPSSTHIPRFGSMHRTPAIGSPNCDELLEKLEREESSLMKETVPEAENLPLNAKNTINDEGQNLMESDEIIETGVDSGYNPVIRRVAGDKKFGPLHNTAAFNRIQFMKEKAEARREYNKLVREDYEREKMSQRMRGEPNWRQILHRLECHTPDGSWNWHHDTLRIRVPCDAIGRLLFSEEYNIWEIRKRCGCQIGVSKAKDASQKHRVLTVSGTVRSITEAAAEILRAAPGAVPDEEIWSQQNLDFWTATTKHLQSLWDDGSAPQATRFVRVNKVQKMAAPVRADKVFRPSTWTFESFGSYVQNLTSIRMSTHLQKMLYGPGKNHTDAVVNILQLLFVDPKCRTAISVSAFNDALAYLVKHNAIHVVRDLYERMETQNLRMNTETFNIMLRGTAKSKSIGNFHYILKLMLLRGYSPNADTWLAFMSAVENPHTKAHILEKMKMKELLHDPRVKRRVCEIFVDMEITTSLENDMSHEEFLKHMAGRYGKNWLSNECASKIVYVLGSRGLISRCWDILELMHARGVRPDNVSIRAVLHHCEKQKNPQGAIETICRMSSLIDYEPCPEAYHSLFNIAWQAQLYCLARVIWRYACLSAATTNTMRKRVIAGYQSAVTSSNWSPEVSKYRPRGEWAARACRFILGVPISLPTLQHSSLNDDSDNILPPQLYRSSIQASINQSKETIDVLKQDIGSTYRDINPVYKDDHLAEEGIDPPEDEFNKAESHVRSVEKDEICFNLGKENSNLNGGKSNSDSKDKNEPVAVSVLEEQAQAFRFWKPKRPFADVLLEAFETDKEWVSTSADHEDVRLEWLVDRAPAIPLLRKGSLPQRIPWATSREKLVQIEEYEKYAMWK